MGRPSEAEADDYDDAWDCAELVDSRGWSMRCGRRKRLGLPKRGKAALQAKVQGQGEEVLRGRSAFSRSIRSGYAKEHSHFKSKSTRNHAKRCPMKKRRNALHNAARSEDLEASCAYPEDVLSDHGFDDILPDTEPCDVGVAPLELDQTWDAMSSTPSTAASLSDVPDEPEQVRTRAPTRWDEAMARAARNQNGAMDWRTVQALRDKTDKAPKLSPFELIRSRFLSNYERQIRNGLNRCFEGPVTLKPTPVASDVEERFLEGCKKCGVDVRRSLGLLRPAFHGTREELHASIFARGLLIPGEGNDVRVRNGSAHGLGIYTAKVENAWLSKGFCSAPRMLVCGVVDDAVNVKQHTMGNHLVTAQSEAVRHVGQAVVVFDSKRVVPLFEASAERFRDVPLPVAATCRGPPRLSGGKWQKDLVDGRAVILYWEEVYAAAAGPRRLKRPAKTKAPIVVLHGLEAFLARRAARRRR